MAREDYLRNVWYVAARSEELTDNLMRRTILDDPLLLYRDHETGFLAALLDRCPHRFAPLSLGKRVSGGIQCGYHGLVFAASGKCVLNPHGNGKILPSAKVPAFPLVERYGMIWIWPGDPALADPMRIPDLGYLETNRRTRGGGYLPTAANYQVITDNILDLSHADFLHPLLDSEGGVRAEAPKVEEQDDGSILVSWTWGPANPMPFLAHMFEAGAQPFTRLSVRWYAPGTMQLTVQSALDENKLDQGIRACAAHIMTPETTTQTHYFFDGVRDFDIDNDDYTAGFFAGARRAFAEEDKPMIEAIQDNMRGETDIFALQPLGLIGDAGGVRVREKLRRLIAAENA